MTTIKRIQPANSIQNTESAETLLPANCKGALQLKAAAAYLDCAEITVRRLVKRGLLRPNRAIKRLLFPIKELNRFLEG